MNKATPKTGEVVETKPIESLDVTKTVEKELTYREKLDAMMGSYIDKNGQPTSDFREAHARYLRAALPNLPSGKYLKQKFQASPTDEIYLRFMDSMFPTEEFIEVGLGAEYILQNNQVVSAFDPSAYIPATTPDGTQNTFVSTLTILAPGPTNMKETKMAYQAYRYIPNFLSGKVDEYLNNMKDAQTKSLRLKEAVDAINTMKAEYAAALVAGGAGYTIVGNVVTPTSKLIISNAGSIFDTLRDIKSVIWNMQNHNAVFTKNSTFGGYYASKKEDIRIVAPQEIINNIMSIGVPLLRKENLEEFANIEIWIPAPKRYKNPDGSNLVDVDFFGANVNDIFIVDISNHKKLYNFSQSDYAYFAGNITDFMWVRKNYIYGVLDWSNSAIFRCPTLNANFSLPTKTVAA